LYFAYLSEIAAFQRGAELGIGAWIGNGTEVNVMLKKEKKGENYDSHGELHL